MRGFFLLLLLTNVSFFAWQFYTSDETRDANDVYRDVLIVNNGMTLLSELPEDKRPALREPEAGEKPKPGERAIKQEQKEDKAKPPVEARATEEQLAKNQATEHCFSVGAIADKASARAFVRWLQKKGAKEISQGEQQGKRLTYWVMLPAYSSRAKANEAAEILSNKRIRDFFIVRSGEHENAVSLGVFSTKEGAQRRYQEISNLKARLRKPRITVVERPTVRYQVSFKIKESEAGTALAAYLKHEQLGQAEEISCK